MSLPVLFLLSSLLLGSAVFMRRPERSRPPVMQLEQEREPANSPPRRRPASRGFSGTLRVELTEGPDARQKVERLLRQRALRVETEALRPLGQGLVAAEYQVQFAVRRDRDRIAGLLLEEARPFVRSATLS